MLSKEIIFAGFGGQGIQTIGKIVAYSGLIDGYNTSWLPSYGPEMRGGTSNCSVIISDTEIGSPIVTSADILVVMNNPSLDKFESYLKTNGFLILDSNLITSKIKRTDIRIYNIPAEKLAQELGHSKYSNIIMLGAIIYICKLVSLESIIKSIKENLNNNYYEGNVQALRKGYDFALNNFEL